MLCYLLLTWVTSVVWGRLKERAQKATEAGGCVCYIWSTFSYDPKTDSPTAPNFTLSLGGEAEAGPFKELPGRRNPGNCSSSAAQRVTAPAREKGRHKCWDTEVPNFLLSEAVGDAVFSLGLNMQKRMKSEKYQGSDTLELFM